MGQLNETYYADVLKERYLGPIRDNLNNATILSNRLQKTADFIDSSGKAINTPVKFGNPQAIGARGDNGALPTADYSKYDNSRTTIKHNYGRIQLSGAVMRSSKDNAGAFAKAVDTEISNMVDGLKKDINRQYITGDGNGKLCQVESVTDANNIVVKNAGGIAGAGEIDATQFIWLNMLVDSYTGAGKNADSKQVTAINETTRTLTITGHGMLADDWIYREDNYGYEMMGLRGIIDNGSVVVTLQSIDSSANTWWQSKVLSASGVKRSVTPALMQGAYTYAQKQGEAPSLILNSFDIRDSYAGGLQNMRRIVNTMKLDGGFEGLEFNGKPVVADEDCPTSVQFFIVESQLAIHRQWDYSWADMDGAVLSRVSGFDAYEAFLFLDAELATFRRNSHSVLYDLQ